MFIIIVPHYWVAVNRSQKFHPATTWRYPPPKHQAIPSSAKRRGVGPSHWSPRCPRPADGIWMDFTSSGNSNPPVLKSRKVENFHIFWGKYHLYITYISPIYHLISHIYHIYIYHIHFLHISVWFFPCLTCQVSSDFTAQLLAHAIAEGSKASVYRGLCRQEARASRRQRIRGSVAAAPGDWTVKIVGYYMVISWLYNSGYIIVDI